MSIHPCLIPEFAPQSGVLLAWPHRQSDWRDRLARIEPVYVALACVISRFEPVVVICLDNDHRAHVERLLHGQLPAGAVVRFVVAPSNDTWVRDYGPLCLATGLDRDVALLDCIFDGWGGKYPAGLDNRVTAALHRAGAFGTTRLQPCSLVLEGGALDTDGEGTLLTTSRCLLHSGRNPALGRLALEQQLALLLGTERVLWLDHGHLEGDDTDGHVDMLARFCSPRDIAYVQCTDPDDVHYAGLQAMQSQLRGFVDRHGQPYRLHPLPLPGPVYDHDGMRLPASYANFLVLNGAVLLPVYRDPADAQAGSVLEQCFPGRSVIPVDCRPLVEQYGALHCATLQLAAGVLPA